MKVVLVTGGFDPLHSGHIEYFNSAKELGDRLIVGINSDSWLVQKKGHNFMPLTERVTIVKNIKSVDEVILFDDTDGTAVDAIKKVRHLYPTSTIIFANGGDRTHNNIPEMNCRIDNVNFMFAVGGDKKNSSSQLLARWKNLK